MDCDEASMLMEIPGKPHLKSSVRRIVLIVPLLGPPVYGSTGVCRHKGGNSWGSRQLAHLSVLAEVDQVFEKSLDPGEVSMHGQ